MKTGILFDLDGTLWDSVPQVCAAFNRVFDRHPELHKHLTEEELRGYMGKQRMEVAAVMMPMAPPDRWYDLMEELFAEQLPYLREHHAAPYPHLVQTLEGTPAIIHGGPFANIAHGCNSIQATYAAMSLADYAVTEAGFGADLGAEKFLDTKCRAAGIEPDCVVVVATVKALKLHGGAAKETLSKENLEALEKGMPNLLKHIENIRTVYKKPVVVAMNRFATDTKAETDFVIAAVESSGAKAVFTDVFLKGGEGGKELAAEVVKACEIPSKLEFAYDLQSPVAKKIEDVAKKIYGADGADFSEEALEKIKTIEAKGEGGLPVIIAKTQYSLSDNPDLIGRPSGFRIFVRDIVLKGGAGFIVAIAGKIMLMPGLGAHPAAEKIDLTADGKIVGLS